MITKNITCTCCVSNKLTRNGKTRTGKQRFRCHTCGCYGTHRTLEQHPAVTPGLACAQVIGVFQK